LDCCFVVIFFFTIFLSPEVGVFFEKLVPTSFLGVESCFFVVIILFLTIFLFAVVGVFFEKQGLARFLGVTFSLFIVNLEESFVFVIVSFFTIFFFSVVSVCCDFFRTTCFDNSHRFKSSEQSVFTLTVFFLGVWAFFDSSGAQLFDGPH